VFLDVREQREWNLFRIAGAVHVPLASVRERVGQAVTPGRRVVVYCARGGRAALAADVLRELGYADVSSIAGGVMGWVNAGGTLEE
jgi:rhodanese-related sulfurtransferase